MMTNKYSIQFKLGIAGIISSLIWISVKFGLFSISNDEWISLSGIIFSFTLFYHYYETEKKSITLVSVFLFYLLITFLIYFNQLQLRKGNHNLDFVYFIYVFCFSIGAFLFLKSFMEEQKVKLLLTAFVLLIGTLLILILEFNFHQWKLDLINSVHLGRIENGIITLSLVLLLYYPVKNIINILKEINTKRKDDSIS